MRDDKDYAFLLREVREKAKLTRQQVKDIWGVPTSTLVAWELKKKKIPVYTAKLLIESISKYSEKNTNYS